MRESKAGMNETKSRIEQLKGVRVLLKVNKGRNKIVQSEGAVKDTYPSVFTFQTDDESLQTYSYADVVTKNVKIYKGTP